jgi:hypothetical protein
MTLANVVLLNPTGMEARIHHFNVDSLSFSLKQARSIGPERIDEIFSMVERIGTLIQAPLAAEIGA